jgi:hypothetical protein
MHDLQNAWRHSVTAVASLRYPPHFLHLMFTSISLKRKRLSGAFGAAPEKEAGVDGDNFARDIF